MKRLAFDDREMARDNTNRLNHLVGMQKIFRQLAQRTIIKNCINCINYLFTFTYKTSLLFHKYRIHCRLLRQTYNKIKFY